MKNVRSFLVLFIVFALTNIAAKAQNNSPLRMGIGINAGSTLKDPTKFVLGGDLRLQKSFGNSVSGILTTGYNQFFKSDKSGGGFCFIPLKIGLKYFPSKNIYITGEIGAGFGTQDINSTALFFATSFIYSPSVGLAFGSGFDVSLKYEAYAHKDYNSYPNQLALRLAYGFKL